MTTLIYKDCDLLIKWAEARIPGCRFRGDAYAIGIENGGWVTGVFVFDTFSTASCLMHVASNGKRLWLGRDLRAVLTPIFAYPFVQCGFRRVTALVNADNRPSLRLAERLGGVREGLLRQEGPGGEDVVVLGMLRSECRWVPASYGQAARGAL